MALIAWREVGTFRLALSLLYQTQTAPQIVFLVRAALADRDGVVDLKAALLARFAQRFLARSRATHLAGIAVAFENVPAQFVRNVAGESEVFGPKGAKECSHGCSAARVCAGGAEPVEAVTETRSAPAGAAEPDSTAARPFIEYPIPNGHAEMAPNSTLIWCSRLRVLRRSRQHCRPHTSKMPLAKTISRRGAGDDASCMQPLQRPFLTG